ncbi:uncharacterized protein CDAR_425961 [Caerostris darwini]|uniref:Uncharacterized protein n=1 Tax=Caerostris darwini TaxID=1538125 RepID=A0AAV4T2A7_9ARAC|nr:uncharacterized protein CDAR_425961 [Caerostris darwini]
MAKEICMKTELDLFSPNAIQLDVECSKFAEIQPVVSLTDNSPLEFFISGNGEQYLDLALIILHLKIKVVKKNGGKTASTYHIPPINYILNTLFSELSVFLNYRQIVNQV